MFSSVSLSEPSHCLLDFSLPISTFVNRFPHITFSFVSEEKVVGKLLSESIPGTIDHIQLFPSSVLHFLKSREEAAAPSC
ncbi:hypothetical protein EXN66_Car000139 [Channa argus]|uniref:Uncharacterized protein n=1 Tax=Channa argus TaxID=215402 RepID=A0A6G1QWV6_CHAAH|nr:hypothetical protein EXN66_Car000139 [Channa argus]